MKDVDYSKPLDNEQHELFCRAYSSNFKGAEAARTAKYSAKTARTQASDLLTRLDIQGRVRHLCSIDLRRVDVSKERILKKLADMAFNSGLSNFGTLQEDGSLLVNLTDCPAYVIDTLNQYEVESVSLVDKDGKKKGNVVTVKVKVKTADSLRALDMLGKYQKMWTERVEVVDVTDRDAKLLAARQRAKDKDD